MLVCPCRWIMRPQQHPFSHLSWFLCSLLIKINLILGCSFCHFRSNLFEGVQSYPLSVFNVGSPHAWVKFGKQIGCTRFITKQQIVGGISSSNIDSRIHSKGGTSDMSFCIKISSRVFSEKSPKRSPVTFNLGIGPWVVGGGTDSFDLKEFMQPVDNL